LEFAVRFSRHLVIFVCVACILDLPRASHLALWRREKLRRRPTRSTQEWALERKKRISLPLRLRIDSGQASQQICSKEHFFVLPRTRAFPFFSQEIFFTVQKNKIHFFLVDFKTGF
jgi:hypothetical protein